MLHLIIRLVPPPVHRALLPLAYRVRQRWRRWRKAPIYGSNVILTDLRGDLLLLRHSYGPQGWCLPGGGVGRKEDPARAALRELEEELRLSPPNLASVGAIEGRISGSPHTMYLFEAVIDQQPRPDRREVMDARFFPLHSLPEPLGETTRQALTVWREKRSRR